MYIYIYIHTYIDRERGRETDRERESDTDKDSERREGRDPERKSLDGASSMCTYPLSFLVWGFGFEGFGSQYSCTPASVLYSPPYRDVVDLKILALSKFELLMKFAPPERSHVHITEGGRAKFGQS